MCSFFERRRTEGEKRVERERQKDGRNDCEANDGPKKRVKRFDRLEKTQWES